jgi:AcrR family transcriptional regulator
MNPSATGTGAAIPTVMHIPGLLRTPCQLLAAGLSKGGLYWHFKSKDEILAAMLMQLFDQEMVVLSRFADNSGSVASRLRQLVRQAIDAVLEMEHTLPVIREFYALANRFRAIISAIMGCSPRYSSRASSVASSALEGLIRLR